MFMVDPLNSSDQTSRHAEPPPELEPESFGGEDFRDVVGGGALVLVVVVGSPVGGAVTEVPSGVRDAPLEVGALTGVRSSSLVEETLRIITVAAASMTSTPTAASATLSLLDIPNLPRCCDRV